MKQTNRPQTGVVPVAYVTKGRQRLKQYDDTVYLRNEDEFELELFNPTTTKVLCKISLNGHSIGSGIVLRPGERVFLERYLDVAKKFKFGTYTVNGENKEVLSAIQENGLVVVKFHKESFPSMSLNRGRLQLFDNYFPPYNPIFSPSTDNPNPYPTWTTSITANSTGNYSGSSTLTSGSALYNSSVNLDSMGMNESFNDNKFDADIRTRSVVDIPDRKLSKKTKSSLKSMETGTIEMGSNSNQPFILDQSTFEYNHTWVSEWKILPVSRKLTVIEDLKVYCVECGAKRKGNGHKFCPNCGTKYE